MLNMVINHSTLHDLYRDPDKYQAEYDLTDEEIDFALQMPRRTIGSFQMQIISKRMRNSQAHRFIGRTLAYMSSGQKGNSMRSFMSTFPMKQNEWMQRVPDFLNLVEEVTFAEHSKADQVNIDVIAFERWVYELFTSERVERPVGTGYVLSPNVQVRSFPFPTELLLSPDTTEGTFARLNRQHGNVGYVLGQVAFKGGKKDVDLYEIDQTYYQLLSRLETPLTEEEFHQAAVAIAQEQGVDKSSAEMLHELLDLQIIVKTGEVR